MITTTTTLTALDLHLDQYLKLRRRTLQNNISSRRTTRAPAVARSCPDGDDKDDDENDNDKDQNEDLPPAKSHEDLWQLWLRLRGLSREHQVLLKRLPGLSCNAGQGEA